MQENKYTFWELIKYILDFFFHRKKLKEGKQKERFKKVSEGLKDDYKVIDEKKESKKKKGVEKRLKNLF